MISLTFDHNFLRNYFEYGKDFSEERKNNPIFNNHVVLIPKNRKIFPYMKYIKSHGNNLGGSYYDYITCLDDYSSKKYEDYLKLEKEIIIFSEDDIIIFEFPDEETAFYFKMKFC